MISPQDRQNETAVTPQQNFWATRYLSLALALILTTGLIATHGLFVYNGEAPLYGSFTPVIGLALWACVGLIWHGRLITGTGSMAVIFWAMIAVVISQRADMGLMLTVSATFFITLLFYNAWPRHLQFTGGLAITVVSLGLILTDLYWPGSRPSIPSFLVLVYYAASIGLILFVTFLVVRRFSDFSLRGKLITTFIAIAGIPLVALAVSNFVGLRNALTVSANQNLLSASSQTAVLLDDFYRQSLDTIRAEAAIMGVAYDWSYYSGLSEEERVGPVGILAEEKAINLLIAYRNRDPEYILSYALLDINGQVLFEYPRSESKADESGRSYYKQVLVTQTGYASPVEFDPVTGQPAFHFSALVVDSLGRQVGVLRARYDAQYLQQLITRSTGLIGGESFAVLFNENNLHLAHGAAPDVLYKLADLPTAQEIATLQSVYRLPDQPLEQLTTNLPKLADSLQIAGSAPIFEAVDVVDEDRINQVGVAFMEEQPWKVAYFQPQDVYLAPEKTLIRRTVLLTVAVLGVAVGVAVVVANSLARPIVQLEQVANRVAQGDFTAQAPEFLGNEAGALARTFNMMTAQIRDSVTNLENRVAERTHALEISGEVSRQLSTILDRQELVKTVVEQVKQAFNFYHAHIYLFDETEKNLIMVGGTGEAGQKMLANKHQIEAGKGLVGRAGQTANTILVSDVSHEDGWLPNPLLPDTKAEIAVPILSGQQVWGVLDVQHNIAGGLSQTDADLLQLIANQVAVALRNARLYEGAQRLVERETLVNEINQKILSTTTMKEALQVAVRELGRVSGSSDTRVQLKAGDQAQNGRKS